MEPVFTIQYGEFAVADYLSKKIKNASVFIPASSQEKGIDILLYRYHNGCNTTNTIQVKMSRTYYSEKPDVPFPYGLWFKRFPIQSNANWYILVGIFAKRPMDANARVTSTCWDTIMLAFTKKEMAEFMANLKQKKDPTKDDRMFGFEFDDGKKVYQSRGCVDRKEMTCFLIDNRLDEIEKSFI